MAARRSLFAVPVAEFAAALLTRPEVGPRAQMIAEQVAQLLPGTAVVVYIVEDLDNPAWTRKAIAGEVEVASTMEFSAGTLGAVADSKTLVVFEGADLQREDYAHLDIRRTVTSLAYVPLLMDDVLFGAIELVSYEQPFPAEMLEALQDVAELASPAIAAARSYESERNASLHSISRVTQMYDLEKVFNSTLEMDELLEIIAKKFQEVMAVQGVNLWMVNNDALELVSRAGFDPTVELGTVQKPGEGIAGDISDNGEPVLIDDPADERLQKRNAGHEDEAVFSLVAASLIEHENLVGVVEAVNRQDGAPFDEDDQFLLTNICETASNALHNASLLQSERKVEILQTLVQVSGEITSTLNLDRVLQSVVNHTQAIIPFERAAIALEQRGSLQLKAISGMAQINSADPAVTALKEMLEWASISNEETHVTQHDEQIDDPRPETRAKFADYFSASGMRAFYALPLIDDQGRLGVLSFESSDPDFLTVAHLEIIKVLAGQATVALRNASLYREVPFIDLLAPLLQKKKRFLAMEKRRRGLMIALAIAAVLFLILCPLPMRVSGEATVASARTAQVQAGVDGVVKNVYIREGDHVQRGTVLAELEDWNYRADLAAAEAKYAEATEAMNRALAQNDGTLAGEERAKVDYSRAELARARERQDRAIIRAPFDGVVTTTQVQNSVGRRLMHGDTFAEIIDTSHVTVDVAVPEDDATLLGSGEHASIKLESFPLRIFRGDATVISPQGQVESEQRVFIARVNVPNPDGAIRPGMQGQGKVSVGWHPAGYVLFRGSAMWLWGKLWSWFGW
ncbi:MAG TPA: efflux RND transporter periplasmic adaptor subunit [Terriglobales bacterium]|nr:efflux RND transporter periplasmic adaptor subunit [Terriglobales bacterium]